MITTVILSEDKPAQLHLLLESLEKNGGNLFDIIVLYDYSDDQFEQGYKNCQNYFYENRRWNFKFPIRWKERRQTTVNEDLLEVMSYARDLVCFFNDENILFNSVASYRTIKELFNYYSLSSLSLRLGNNTVIQNPYELDDYFVEIPEKGEFVMDKFLIWNATDPRQYTNFGMPFSTNGHIYHRNVIKNVLQLVEIETVDDFEESIQKKLYGGYFEGKVPPLMSCLEYSSVIHNSIRRVMDSGTNGLGLDLPDINKRYLDGKKIDYDSFDFRHISMPFEEFPARFL